MYLKRWWELLPVNTKLPDVVRLKQLQSYAEALPVMKILAK